MKYREQRNDTKAFNKRVREFHRRHGCSPSEFLKKKARES